MERRSEEELIRKPGAMCVMPWALSSPHPHTISYAHFHPWICHENWIWSLSFSCGIQQKKLWILLKSYPHIEVIESLSDGPCGDKGVMESCYWDHKLWAGNRSALGRILLQKQYEIHWISIESPGDWEKTCPRLFYIWGLSLLSSPLALKMREKNSVEIAFLIPAGWNAVDEGQSPSQGRKKSEISVSLPG